MSRFFKNIQKNIIRTIDWFHFPILHFIPKEVFRYAVTGGLNMILDLSMFFFIYNYLLDKKIMELGFIAISPHIAAFLIVFPITFTTGFLLAKYITFTASELHGRIQLLRYGITVAGSILLNYIFLKLFVEYFDWYATFSKGITTIIVVIYSYIFQRYFSFKTGSLLIQQKVAD